LIHLFTDFGWNGPYVGEMKAVLARDLAGISIVDLMHDAPTFNPKASAYLLAALSQRFMPGDICLAVVDPGVGDNRRKAMILEADGRRYVGPDNGLFAIIARNATALHCEEILWRPAKCSDSFHGRDVFAPVVSCLYKGSSIETRLLSPDSLIGLDYPEQLAEVIYIDHYGNAVTGLNAEYYTTSTRLSVAGREIVHARTFSCVAAGEVFWYTNSMGLFEIAANASNASTLLNLTIGSQIDVIMTE
jgi:S-adenosylmethionine hydrolase